MSILPYTRQLSTNPDTQPLLTAIAHSIDLPIHLTYRTGSASLECSQTTKHALAVYAQENEISYHAAWSQLLAEIALPLLMPKTLS
jgi:hypothetical protein